MYIQLCIIKKGVWSNNLVHLLSVPNRWIPDCGEVFRTHKEKWAHLIPPSSDERPILAEHFFNTACSLMARQLRECIEESINELLAFLTIYKVSYCQCCNKYTHDKYSSIGFIFRMEMNLKRSSLKILCSQQRL